MPMSLYKPSSERAREFQLLISPIDASLGYRSGLLDPPGEGRKCATNIHVQPFDLDELTPEAERIETAVSTEYPPLDQEAKTPLANCLKAS